MNPIIPYLYFNGNCEEALNFYQATLGGQIPYIGRYKDVPPTVENQKVSEADGEKVMHATLYYGNGGSIMASDVPEGYGGGPDFKTDSNVSLSLNADSREQADAIFNGLSAGGEITMPLQETFWGAYFGMWTDKFGIKWMVNYDDPAKAQKH